MGRKDVFKVGDAVYLNGYAEHANKPEFWAKVTEVIEIVGNSPILYEISFSGNIELKLPADLLERVPDIKATLNDINTIFRLTNPIDDEVERLEIIEKNSDHDNILNIEIDIPDDDDLYHND